MTAFGFPPHMAFSVPIPTATYFWSLLEVVSIIIVVFKEGASFCYCAYVLCISSSLGFLRNLPLKQQYFYVAYEYVEKKQILARAIRIQKENSV